MCYASYDYQSSHEGYIDMEFKEIVKNPPKPNSEWLSSGDLYELIVGYGYYVVCDYKLPEFMSRVFDFEGDIKSARVSKRLVKRWCENASENGLP